MGLLHELVTADPARPRRAALLLAAFAAVLTLALQWATVACNHGGDWSALFVHGADYPAAPQLEWEGHRPIAATGFDGQIYHLIAHDPFLLDGLDRYVDAPRLRYRRILVPLAAHVLALGRARWIDTAYRAVILLFVFAGTWWSARCAIALGRAPLWGLAFLLVPAVAISAERMTVDVGLAALTAGFALYAARPGSWRLMAVLALAALVRETGVLLALGVALATALAGQWRRALRPLLALLPALAWFAYVHARTPSYEYPVDPRPLSGAVRAMISPDPAPDVAPGQVGEWWRQTILRKPAFDRVALLGVLLALALGLWGLRPWPPGEAATAAGLFALLGVVSQRADQWLFVHDYGRVYSPLLVLLLLRGLRERRVVLVLPLVLMWPRMLLEMTMQVVGILRAALH
ncbi:MAG TPA: hypothetical protein VFQ51_01850 [Vicinamibacteria bacterium]|nr:hypothetical protein [Vicinamibacteria bacterium]